VRRAGAFYLKICSRESGLGGAGGARGSGHWLVASGWSRKRWAEASAVKSSQTQSNWCDSGGVSSRTRRSQNKLGAAASRAARPPEDSPVRANQDSSKLYQPKRDAYVSARAEIAFGRDHQTESNQIKPNQTCGTVKMFEVSSSRPQIQCPRHQNRRRRRNKDDHSFRESTVMRWRLLLL
jgi:hypothetical protein